MPVKKGEKPRPFPARSLEKSLVIIQAIVDKGASQSMDKLLVAQAIGRTPSSSEFKRLLSTSLQYGLTKGTEKANHIVPTELGLKITKPISTQEKANGLVEACLNPPLMNRVFNHFNNNKLPDTQFLTNMLEKSFEVESSKSGELAALLKENAKYCGILQDISGSFYIRIEDPILAEEMGSDGPKEDQEPNDSGFVGTPAPLDQKNGLPQDPKIPTPSQGPKQLFVAHGKNMKPLEDLKKILGSFGIAFKVAVDEPHAGRPISAKVANLMKECSAGIFIFTRDEQLFTKNKEGDYEEIWRPSENVVYELGAATILWEGKIIILKEDGVTLPTDFKDLGYITFSNGEVGTKALELMKELIALGLVKVQAV